MHILKPGKIGNRLHQNTQMKIGRIGKFGASDAHPRLARIRKNRQDRQNPSDSPRNPARMATIVLPLATGAVANAVLRLA